MDFPNFDNNENNNQDNSNNFNNQDNLNNFDNQQNNFDNQQSNNFDNQQSNNVDNQQNNNFENFGGDNEIQIENMEFSNNEKTNQPMDHGMGQGMEFNEIPNQMDSNHMGNSEIDEEERNRIQARKEEEEARRAKIVKKMNDEMRIKQEFRDKAREYADHWNEYF
jgi:hypothetical protein